MNLDFQRGVLAPLSPLRIHHWHTALMVTLYSATFNLIEWQLIFFFTFACTARKFYLLDSIPIFRDSLTLFQFWVTSPCLIHQLFQLFDVYKVYIILTLH